MLLGGIEAGGTKFVCAVGDESGKIIAKTSFPTTEPDETLRQVRQFFQQHHADAVGIGCFGPVDLDEKSNTYGTILNTPKTKWKQYDILTKLKTDLQIPVSIDTDVNAAALGEYLYGAGKDVDSCMYITVGTGIGAGFVHHGKTYIGKSHPEMGHLLIQQHKDDTFAGNCPYHGNCLEGLASGPAIEQRYGEKGVELANDVHVWELEAYYLAQAIMNYFLVLSPERIILGGGVMKQEQLYPRIREKFRELLNSYLDVENMDKLIVAPELNDEQGIRGAMELLRQ
ncbi:ROK family protein [Lentibacillus sp. L22]|uniref:ROK family protein n=1 Tax=Lentibacillus TaxID=175304 RepID=UPI0022B151DB|nr:ROK family protein [Lentibacillus daqui]